MIGVIIIIRIQGIFLCQKRNKQTIIQSKIDKNSNKTKKKLRENIYVEVVLIIRFVGKRTKMQKRH